MKIAIVYNSTAAEVLQRRGVPTREIYDPAAIRRIVDALQREGHQTMALESDRHLIDRLESFLAGDLRSEWPGLVLNLAYGVQGRLRYCHLPGILEMLGIPYVGSGPLGHALASDKAAAKVLFRHRGLPTPDFAVLDSPAFPRPDLGYPLVLKPIAEAASVGVRLVHDERELQGAVEEILTLFQQPALAERYAGDREINVSVLGNTPPEALPPVEVVMGKGGPPIFTHEDKRRTANRNIRLRCPAPLPEPLTEQARRLALEAFVALGCEDWARVDMRLDNTGRLQLLEVNTLPALSAHSSYVKAAEQAGMDLAALLRRLIAVAVKRYRLDVNEEHRP